MAKKEIVDLPISKLKHDPDNEIAFTVGDIDSLAESIKTHGFQGAITVYKLSKPEGDYEYEILYGHRRTLAMQSLGHKTIPAIIIKKPADDMTRGELLLVDNIHGRRFTPYDWAKAISYYRELCYHNNLKGRFDSRAAKFFDFSVPQINNYLVLSKLIPELKEFSKSNDFPVSAFKGAATFTPEEQLQLYDMIVNNYNSEGDDPEYRISRNRLLQMIDIIKSQRDANKNDQKRTEIFIDKVNAGIIKPPYQKEDEKDFDEPDDDSYANESYDKSLEKEDDIDLDYSSISKEDIALYGIKPILHEEMSYGQYSGESESNYSDNEGINSFSVKYRFKALKNGVNEFLELDKASLELIPEDEKAEIVGQLKIIIDMIK